MMWVEIGVQVEREDMEAVIAIYDLIGTGGVEIEDPALIYSIISNGNEETVAINTPVDKDAPPVIKGYLPLNKRLAGKLKKFHNHLATVAPSCLKRVMLREVDDNDWKDRWKKFYHPVKVGRRLLVKPAWENAGGAAEDRVVIEMDPGMAFGCGTHTTTVLGMCLLEDIISGGETVIDVGTGSGILAVTAAKLGAAAVVAVDSDPVAVRAARENAACNGMKDIINVRGGNLLDGIEIKADIIVANIIADVIIRLLPAAATHLPAGGKFIASGIIAGRKDEVAAAIVKSGLIIRENVNQGEWSAFLAKKGQ